MLVYRLTRQRHQALDGEGARLYGGRWTPEGVAVVYTASSLPLAALEYLAHVDTVDAQTDLVAMTISVPDNAGTDLVEIDALPADWSRLVDHPATVAIGAAWAQRASSLVLRVPSVLISEEQNVLLNPGHDDMHRVRVERVRNFSFDPRLTRRVARRR